MIVDNYSLMPFEKHYMCRNTNAERSKAYVTYAQKLPIKIVNIDKSIYTSPIYQR